MAKKKFQPDQLKLGWLPDIPDARDFLYAAPLKVMLKLPVKIDLRSKISKPQNL